MKVSTVDFDKKGIDVNLFLKEYCRILRQGYGVNKKVLLIQIPQFIFKSFNPEIAKGKGYYIFPPTGLQYLFESLKEEDLDVRILDLNFMVLKKISEEKNFDCKRWLSILEDYLDSFKPFIIGVSCMYDSGIQPLIQVLEFLKRRNRSVVIAGGVIATYENKNLTLRDLCHFVIKGEGENKINSLFNSLIEGEQNSRISAGICFKYEDTYLETDGDEEEVTLNSDLIDSYSSVKIEEYYRYGSLNPFSRMAGIYDSPFAAIQMSRGCRGICTFCSVRDFIGREVRKRPLDKLLAEMEFLIEKRGVKHFEWLDDDLLFYKKDFKLLLETVIEKRWGITWSANNGLIATSIDDNLMRLMRDSGCIGFKIGIETGNEDMLKSIRKPATTDSFRRVSRICAGYPEIFVGGNFMLGFPHEKFCQMMDSFRFHLELNLDWGAFTICQAIRGATAFSDFEDYFEAQIDSGGENTKNFVPTRESSRGMLSTTGEGILKGLDVFKLDPDSVPNEDQIKEIWFTFNLVGNFINNKNLRPDGRVEKFISWVEMAQVAYPMNPYMSLFLSLAYIIKGEMDRSRDYYNKAIFCNKGGYWQERFASFGLNKMLNNFPQTKQEVFEALQSLCRLTLEQQYTQRR